MLSEGEAQVLESATPSEKSRPIFWLIHHQDSVMRRSLYPLYEIDG
jgi:hypothetical protein